MIDRTLINTLDEMVKEKKKKEFFKTRPRIKGKIAEKTLTKKGNIQMIVQKGDEKVSFTILKTHKERFALAERLNIGNTVYAAGIPKLRMNICTQLRPVLKETDNLRQTKIG